MLTTKKKVLIICLIIILMTITTGVIVDAHWINLMDSAGFNLADAMRKPLLTTFFINYTRLFNVTPALIIITVIALILGVTKKWADLSFFIITAVICNAPLNSLLKNFVNRPRPTQPHLVTVHSTSFPSGHSMAAMIIIGALVIIINSHLNRQLSKRMTTIIGASLILLVGYSRIYVGVHFLSDVLAGLIIGLLVLIVTKTIFNKYHGGFSHAQTK